MEPTELAQLLAKLRGKAPEVYRHIIGVIKAVLNLKK
jgi:hypothetical protein